MSDTLPPLIVLFIKVITKNFISYDDQEYPDTTISSTFLSPIYSGEIITNNVAISSNINLSSKIQKSIFIFNT